MFKIFAIGSGLLTAVPVVHAVARAPSVQYFPHAGSAPVSSAVRVGDFVFVSGATGKAVDGSVPTNFIVQAKNAMDTLVSELKRAGASLDDVYRCNLALTDNKNWEAFNAVYRKYFASDRFPVRMAIGNADLGGSAVEIQCDAFIGRQ